METTQENINATAQFGAKTREVFMANSVSLVSLAGRMALDPVAAIALPTVITVAARKASMSEDALVRFAYEDAPLRDYLAGICRDADVSAALQ